MVNAKWINLVSFELTRPLESQSCQNEAGPLLFWLRDIRVQDFSVHTFSPRLYSLMKNELFSPRLVSPEIYSPRLFIYELFSPECYSPRPFSPRLFSPKGIINSSVQDQNNNFLSNLFYCY